MPRTTRRSDDNSSPLLSQRATLILLLAMLTGVGAAVLMAWAGRHPAEAALVGVGALAGGTGFFNWIIGG
ncbi:hypothetical protein SAMN04488564_102360 [Lentzea waywayandensis]|uniref:Uncharacterized protein n=1 Tax=Lentzea waywayandensis TaxID=84724 RepID=A0A1I6DE36_9PSEU|nr:hypothetical protein [Lentzea waywayandensis]SFR03631.1 hypothetical protein SAMN04488564_102360 [Lentzea waywayandensis]